jgi:hypothetical protein
MKISRVHILILIIFILLAACLFSGVYWLKSSWLSQPSLDHVSYAQLQSGWQSKDKPLFPSQSTWNGDFEFHILLSSRFKWKATYIGYGGGGPISKLAQDVPFLVFYTECRLNNSFNGNAGSKQLAVEKITLVKNIIVDLSFNSLDADTLKNIREKTVDGNFIEFNAIFSYQKYSYHIHGIIQTSEPEFSLNDPAVASGREVIIQYLEDMAASGT